MVSFLKKILAVQQMLSSRIFAVAALTLFLAFTVFQVTSLTHIVSVREGSEVQVLYTMEDDPMEILAQTGIVTMAYDAVDFSGFQGMVGEINITRGFAVVVHVDNTKIVHMTTGGTVEQVLQEAQVELGRYDIVDLPRNQMVAENDVITVTRQKYVKRKVEVEIPFQCKTIPTSLLGPGQQEVRVEGENGLKLETYTQQLIDGQPGEAYNHQEELIRPAVDQEVLVGFASQPVSSLDFGHAFDESGAPIEYKQVLRGQRAAGYSARPGARTASGLPAVVGHVAVNPRIIPYGSKLFIQSSDGKFVYGYAVAADTGTAIMQGTIAVDLFYGSYAESARNGIRSVDIYVLE